MRFPLHKILALEGRRILQCMTCRSLATLLTIKPFLKENFARLSKNLVLAENTENRAMLKMLLSVPL